MGFSKPIFAATHPRACSTAFERVFMTRPDILQCVHEPFGDAFYYGPERLSARFEKDEAARARSGFANVTYKDVLDLIVEKAAEGKRIFIKDIAHYLLPPNGAAAEIAPSLKNVYGRGSAKPGTGVDVTKSREGAVDGVGHANGNGSVMAEANGAAVDDPQGGTATDTNTSGSANPTVMPKDVLSQFHFAFLIRHPRRAIPSYYRCTVPPLDEVTGFHDFMPSEAGYDELRRLFDYLKDEGLIGPARAGQPAGQAPRPDEVRITVIDADDLLDKPEEVIRAFCVETGIDFSPDMLAWKDEQNQQRAVKAFEKWKGFHNDAIDSDSLKPRKHGVRSVSEAEEDEEWRQRFGDKAQKLIRDCVNANTPDYEYLKSFAINV